MLLSIASVILTVYVLYSIVGRIISSVNTRSALNKLPQLPYKSYFFFGHAYLFGKDPHNMFRRMKDVWLQGLEKTRDSGKIFFLNTGFVSNVFITHPDSAQTLLKSSKEITKGNIMRLLSDWLADGLVLSSGKKWWHRRRLLTPAFHFSILDKFLDVMNDQTAVFINNLHTAVDERKDIDIEAVLGSLTLDIICETAMGVKVNAQSGEALEYAKAVKR